MYISVVKLFVNDVDRAINFYTEKLGWEKTMDAPMGDGTRWVTVAPPGAQTAFTLAKDSPNQTHEQLKKIDIEFTEGPRSEPWGGWATFKDSEGNVHGLHSPVPASVSNN